LDQAPRISIAVKYRSAVVLLIMTVSPVMVWANDHSNKPWLRHQPRKLRLGQRFGHSRVIVERPFGVDNCLMHCDKASGGFCLKSRRQIALIPVQPRVAKRPEADRCGAKKTARAGCSRRINSCRLLIIG
jgi:hypothetical protein